MESIEISQYLKKLKFKKSFIGGLDEEEKKIRKLDEMYQKELERLKKDIESGDKA